MVCPRFSVIRHLGALLKSSFVLAGPFLQPAFATWLIVQTIARWTGEINGELSQIIDNPNLAARLQLLPSALLFCVDSMDNVIHQISREALFSVHMHRILWRQAWLTQHPQ